MELVLFERERMPWSQRDSSREMRDASFLDTGSFIPVPSRVLGVKLTVGQSAGLSTSQSRSGENY